MAHRILGQPLPSPAEIEPPPLWRTPVPPRPCMSAQSICYLRRPPLQRVPSGVRRTPCNM
jgi:hypothetical protein